MRGPAKLSLRSASGAAPCSVCVDTDSRDRASETSVASASCSSDAVLACLGVAELLPQPEQACQCRTSPALAIPVPPRVTTSHARAAPFFT